MEQMLTSGDYQALAELRHQIRPFVHLSGQAVRSAGLHPRQHQLMLALKGLPSHIHPSVRELAKRLQVRHHSTVELVNRLVQAGYVRRRRGGQDRGEVLSLTPTEGERVWQALSSHQRTELRSAGPALIDGLRVVIRGTGSLDPVDGKT
jgi:DNA-binding MarR family transcriptional regulator